MIIGAGSVVTTDIPDGCVYAGNPAKFICKTEEFRNKHIEKSKDCLIIERPWRELASITPEEQKRYKEQLANGHGYVRLKPLD